MSYSALEIWFLILGLGIGTFLLRFSFLGLIGDRELPVFFQRMLRYTAVAVLPGIVAPLVLWPQTADGQTDPARLVAVAVTAAIGWYTRKMLFAILGGAVTFFALQALMQGA